LIFRPFPLGLLFRLLQQSFGLPPLPLGFLCFVVV
jgi:hypothetical protein